MFLDNQRVAERLMYVKRKKELTYKKISEITGISPHTVDYVFRTGKCNTNTLHAICCGLNISADYILGFKKRGRKMNLNPDNWKPCKRCAPRCMECKNLVSKRGCGDCGEEMKNFVHYDKPRWRFCPDCGRPQTVEAWNGLLKRLEEIK